MKLFIQFNPKLKNNNQVKMHYKVPFMQLRRKIKYQVIRLLDIIIANNLDEPEISGITRY